MGWLRTAPAANGMSGGGVWRVGNLQGVASISKEPGRGRSEWCTRRRQWIAPLLREPFTSMMPVVLQHVAPHVCDLSRAAEDDGVVAVNEDRAPPSGQRVQ